MTAYRVTWSMDIEADGPVMAAKQAWRTLGLAPLDIATTFEVVEQPDGRAWKVDIHDPRNVSAVSMPRRSASA